MRFSPPFFIFSAAIAVALCLPSAPAAINASQAIKYLGRDVIVNDRVTSVYRDCDGFAYITFGPKYPNYNFAIKISKECADAGWIDRLLNKKIQVRGVVEVRDRRPVISIKEKSRITENQNLVNVHSKLIAEE
jgi:hypothetical protein